MKFWSNCFCLLIAIVLLPILLHTSSPVYASQEDFEALIVAIDNEEFDQFENLLNDGANPNFIGEYLGSPIKWVNCIAARLRPLKWIKLIETYGGFLEHVRTDYATNAGNAIYASALICSIRSRHMETFTYLVNNSHDPTLEICHLCKDSFHTYSILDATVRINAYQKTAWLLENTEFAKDMINNRILSKMNRSAGIRKDRLVHFWKTVDIVRDLGYEVTPRISRSENH